MRVATATTGASGHNELQDGQSGSVPNARYTKRALLRSVGHHPFAFKSRQHGGECCLGQEAGDALHDAYTPDDLVFNTIGETVLTLGGPQGEGAAKNWVSYLHQRMDNAYRQMTTRSKRRGRRAAPVVDEETGEERELFEAIDVPRGGARAERRERRSSASTRARYAVERSFSTSRCFIFRAHDANQCDGAHRIACGVCVGIAGRAMRG